MRLPTRTPALRYLKANPRCVGWDYSVMALEQALGRCAVRGIRTHPVRGVVAVSKAMARLHLLRRGPRLTTSSFFVPLMGRMEWRLFPMCYIGRTVVYCYDCWEPEYDWWESFFCRHRFELIFFSARDSAEHFTRRLPSARCIWLPEATDPSGYSSETLLAARALDVIELGRRWSTYHDAIALRLEREERTHLYESRPGDVIYPSRRELVEGLGDARISVLFPSSLTHPSRSGAVTTVTHKYFESMASGCLLVGRSPKELIDIFGYNPVIEASDEEPAEQLVALLNRIDDYQELVDRNYQRLLEVGTWDARVPELLSAIESTLGPNS